MTFQQARDGYHAELMQATVDRAARARTANLEMLAAAYLKETNIPASEAELVEQVVSDEKGTRMVWYFRKRGGA